MNLASPPSELRSDIILGKTQEQQRKIDENFNKKVDQVKKEMIKRDNKRPKGDYTPGINQKKKKRKAEKLARKVNRG